MWKFFREGPLVFLQSAEGSDIFTLAQAEESVDIASVGLQYFGFAVNRNYHPAVVEEVRKFGTDVFGRGTSRR